MSLSAAKDTPMTKNGTDQPGKFDELRFTDEMGDFITKGHAIVKTVMCALEQDEEYFHLFTTLGAARDNLEMGKDLLDAWWQQAGLPRLHEARMREAEDTENSPFSPWNEDTCDRLQGLIDRSREERAASAVKAAGASCAKPLTGA